MTLHIAFLGNDPWSVPAFEAIAGEPDLAIELVVTNPPKAAGRGDVLTPTAVAGAARRLDVALVEAPGVRDGVGAAALSAARPDAIVVVAYGELLTSATMAIAPYGAINLHFSLLPRWRGAAPVQRAIGAGDPVTGVTVMRMNEGLDTGPILNQLEERVRPEDDAGTLGLRLAKNGALLLVGVLRMLPAGGVPARAQDDRAATTAPRIGPDERVIDWSKTPESIVRWVRALSPQPAATTMFRGQPLKVLAAAVDHQDSQGSAGTIVGVDVRGVLVRAGGGGVRLVEVSPSGRKRMDGASWARGARFVAGERLG
ncbi:MAG: methionyl-tRNA formyltransferase [Actinomycetota bacterium]